MRGVRLSGVFFCSLAGWACGGDAPTEAPGVPTGSSGAAGASGAAGSSTTGGAGSGSVAPPTAASCAAEGGSSTVAAPELLIALKDRYQESWLASPAVADLDGDGKVEIIVPREGIVIAWHADGSIAWKFDTGVGRIWASAVVADFRGDKALEVAVAARDKVWLLDATGAALPGFPVTWEDEIRALAAGDVDGDGQLDMVASVGHGKPTDVINAWHADGSVVKGFPPNATGTSGCAVDGKCYFAGCYDQNLAVGSLDDDAKQDIIAPHDDAYASFFHGSGEAFDANPMFPAKKTPGVRYLHDLALAKQGYADDEATALQAHFTNTAPAIADIDGDGKYDVVMLGSVQNASQDNRLQGVGLWVLHPDASRLAGWESPFHAKDYLAGLWDFDGINIVAATNQVSIADIDAAHAGPEMVFAGFDGRIHAVSAKAAELWSYVYTTDDRVLTGGVVIGDLSKDGIPEIVFATYSADEGKGELVVLDAGGNLLHHIALPHHGAMAVPTLADVDGNGTVDIVVSLKDAEDKVESVRVYKVAGSGTKCLSWPTGRGNLLRNAWVPKP